MKRYVDLKLMSTIAVTILIGFITGYIFFSMLEFNSNLDKRSTEHITKIIQKAAVQCYALEGAYPPDVYYLADNYKIKIDEDVYHYYYNVFGDNVMPEIQVILKD